MYRFMGLGKYSTNLTVCDIKHSISVVAIKSYEKCEAG